MTKEEKIQQILQFMQIDGNVKIMFIAMAAQNLPNIEEDRIDVLLSLLQSQGQAKQNG